MPSFRVRAGNLLDQLVGVDDQTKINYLYADYMLNADGWREGDWAAYNWHHERFIRHLHSDPWLYPDMYMLPGHVFTLNQLYLRELKLGEIIRDVTRFIFRSQLAAP